MPTPATVDMRPLLPPVRDQGQRGTCLAFAVTATHENARAGGGTVSANLSEEALYWRCKQIDGNTQSGTTFGTMVTALPTHGQTEDTTWPYDSAQDETSPAYVPPAAAMDPTTWLKATLAPLRLDIDAFRSALQGGHLVAISLRLSVDFLITTDGNIPLPAAGALIPDAHAVTLVGFDDTASHFIIRNSWGDACGDAGYGYLPFAYVQQYAIRAFEIGSVL